MFIHMMPSSWSKPLSQDKAKCFDLKMSHEHIHSSIKVQQMISTRACHRHWVLSVSCLSPCVFLVVTLPVFNCSGSVEWKPTSGQLWSGETEGGRLEGGWWQRNMEESQQGWQIMWKCTWKSKDWTVEQRKYLYERSLVYILIWKRLHIHALVKIRCRISIKNWLDEFVAQ